MVLGILNYKLIYPLPNNFTRSMSYLTSLTQMWLHKSSEPEALMLRVRWYVLYVIVLEREYNRSTRRKTLRKSTGNINYKELNSHKMQSRLELCAHIVVFVSVFYCLKLSWDHGKYQRQLYILFAFPFIQTYNAYVQSVFSSTFH